MTQNEKLHYLENELKMLKRQIEFIQKRFGLAPDRNELEEAIGLMLSDRDTSRLDDYLARGGKIITEQNT
jgi:hypothetical protein